MLGFKEAKQQVIRDLHAGNFVHEVRRNISSKNLPLTGVSARRIWRQFSSARGGTITAVRPTTGTLASGCTRSSPVAGT